tara:strand:+ start:470 stop:793 length:324 start_codon:yes stop_codon:yes gene_type:complete
MKLFRTLVFLSSFCNFGTSFAPKYKISPTVSKVIVKKATAFLPAVDTIGHNVLNLNREIIDYMIDSNLFTPEIKKIFILFLIELAQGGDMMGTVFLDIYYNLVCFLL